MELTYELKPQDLAAFYEFHHDHSKAAKQVSHKVIFFGMIILSLLPGLILLTSEDDFVTTARSIWPLLAGPVLFFVYIRWRMRSRNAKFFLRMASEGQSKDYFGESRVHLDEEGIRDCKDSGETFRKWSSVEKIAVTPNYVFIYTSGVEAFIIPTRCFGDSQERENFVGFASDHSDVDPDQTLS